MSRFIFHPQAKTEFEDVIAWYADQSEDLGARFRRSVETALASIDQFPFAHPAVRNGWRRLLVHRFPYGLIYRPVGETIYILAVFHGSRNPQRWRKRL